MFPPEDRVGSIKTACKLVNPVNSCCLVLGGGGARGLAHLGAMQAIGELRVPVNRLVGVSMGALMAAFCVVELDPQRARRRIMEFLDSSPGQKLQSSVSSGGGLSGAPRRRWGTRFFREIIKHAIVSRAVRSQSLLPSTILRDSIDALVPDIDIQDLPTPLQIVTVDLISGQRVVLDSGSLRRAIRASMSIPGIFPAVRHEGRLLSDIGAYNLVPTDVPPSGQCLSTTPQEHVIAIDVGQQMDERTKCNSALDAMLRSQFLAEQAMRQITLAKADMVIRPNLGQAEWFDFSDPLSIIDAGYHAASQAFGGGRQDAKELAVPIMDLNSPPCKNTIS
jgi:NTE family protein